MCYQPIVTVGAVPECRTPPFSESPFTVATRVSWSSEPAYAATAVPSCGQRLVGRPSDKLRQMVDMCLASVNTSLANLKPGAVCGDVAAASERAIGPCPRLGMARLLRLFDRTRVSARMGGLRAERRCEGNQAVLRPGWSSIAVRLDPRSRQVGGHLQRDGARHRTGMRNANKPVSRIV